MSDDELFLTAILNCSRSQLYTRPVTLTAAQQAQLEAMRSRRATGEPVQYICGFTEFMGHRIEVGPGVLVPRPETEVLADAVIRELGGECRVLDLGTGSGCIPVAVLKALPKCRVVGVDVSAGALAYARRNAAVNAVADRALFIEQDMFAFMAAAAEQFDAVISNPPYVPSSIIAGLPADVRCEPGLALDGGPDGMDFYGRLIPGAGRLLRDRGLLALEFGDGQAKDLEKLLVRTARWDKIRIINDNTGRERIILARKI